MSRISREIIVRDNFLPPSLFSEIKNVILSPQIPWTFSDSSTYSSVEQSDKDISLYDSAFTHVAWSIKSDKPETSPYYEVVRPVLFFIEDKLNFKVKMITKINYVMMIQSRENFITPYHLDNAMPHYVGILYLKTCNGPTIVEDQRIDCVENRFLFFDGRCEHAATTQTDEYTRVNVVFNVCGYFKN